MHPPPTPRLILVVDDDSDVREAFSEFLLEEGFRVRTAANGVQALRYLATGERPALILLDLMMPVMDGMEFRRRQRQDPTLSDIPVIIFSAGRVADASADAAAFFPKPVDITALLGAIDRFALA